MPAPILPLHARAAAPADPAADRRMVWRYLRALGAGAHEADDLAQEAMLVACRNRRAAGEDRDRAQAFLRGVARNLWLRSRRWWRRRREREIAVAVDELWQAAADDGGQALVARLRGCLQRLQPRARQALRLHYEDGLGWREVAARTGLRPNGVKSLVQRARAALRQCLERGRDDDEHARGERT